MTDEKLIQLTRAAVRLGLTRCATPGGRFGEDECGKCTTCRLIREFDRRDKEKQKLLKKRVKKPRPKPEPMSFHEPTIGMTEAGY